MIGVRVKVKISALIHYSLATPSAYPLTSPLGCYGAILTQSTDSFFKSKRCVYFQHR